ncbi:hypothetical protein [Arthrobacter sp. KK5.5]|uniref:hypothetical protein n=1 Tax=Arthrobacter sp. KK5.5 TaxID=3373084 RepID=UPI003EE54E5F
MTRFRAAVVVGCLASGLLLGGCGAAPYERSQRGLPEGVTGGEIGEPAAVWTAYPELFAVVLYGSSSCPPEPATLDVAEPDKLIMTLKEASSGPCTADLAPTSYEFAAPDGLDTGTDIAIRIGGRSVVLGPPAD